MSLQDDWDVAERISTISARVPRPMDTPVAQRYDPTEGMSPFATYSAGYGKSAVDLLRGGKQLFDIPAVWLERKFGRVPFGPSAEESAAQTRADIEEAARLDKPLMATTGGFLGNLSGNVLNTLPFAGMRGANTVAGGASIGALYGALQPTETDLGKLGMTAAGALGGAVVPVAANAIKGAHAVVSPMTEAGRDAVAANLLRKVAGDDWRDVALKLTNAREIVPGSVPTAGQVSGSGGIAAMERAMTQAAPDEFARRAQEQVAARSAALREIAGAPGELESAKARLSAIGNKLYSKAMGEGIDEGMAQALKPQIESLLRRPAMRQALDRTKNVFGEQDIELAAAGDVRGLQSVKMALDDILEKAANPGSSMGSNELRALRQTRADLISVMQDIAPALRTADVRYAKAARPVNRMEVGQELVNKLEPALRDYGPLTRETANSYAQALRRGDVLASNVLGRQTTLADLMGPQRMDTLESIAADLARKAESESLGRGVGSNTFQNIAMGNVLEKSGVHGLPNLLSRPVQIGEYLLRGIYNKADQDIKRTLADAMLNPELAGRMMLSGPSPTTLRLADLLKRGTTAGAIGAVPTIHSAQ